MPKLVLVAIRSQGQMARGCSPLFHSMAIYGAIDAALSIADIGRAILSSSLLPLQCLIRDQFLPGVGFP